MWCTRRNVVHDGVPPMHSWTRCHVSCDTPAVGILVAVESHVAAVGAPEPQTVMQLVLWQTGHWKKKKRKKTHKAQKLLQLFLARHYNPSQRGAFGCTLPLSLWHRKECVEAERDWWMDGWTGGSLLFVSPTCHLFGEFADDTDKCSIFIFKTLVICSQVNQDLMLTK